MPDQDLCHAARRGCAHQAAPCHVGADKTGPQEPTSDLAWTSSPLHTARAQGVKVHYLQPSREPGLGPIS